MCSVQYLIVTSCGTWRVMVAALKRILVRLRGGPRERNRHVSFPGAIVSRLGRYLDLTERPLVGGNVSEEGVFSC